MGANFVTCRLVDGGSTPTRSQPADLAAQFHRIQEEACYEGGHDTYAGHIGIAPGLQINHRTFEGATEAYAWLEEHCEKWEPACAVKVVEDGKPAFWLVGAWVAS